MNPPQAPPVFGASIAELSERHLVPLFFEPSAVDLAARAALRARCRFGKPPRCSCRSTTSSSTSWSANSG